VYAPQRLLHCRDIRLPAPHRESVEHPDQPRHRRMLEQLGLGDEADLPLDLHAQQDRVEVALVV
jgi:hypothetical protein